ncbi:MAG: tRNA pseudouridine(55) synthase TruB [bacterium]
MIDKPAFITSYDVIRKIKAFLPAKKIGHTGTLDPLATGLMILLIGTATKLAHYFIGLNKVYRFTMKFGEETDTMDSTGRVVKRCDYTFIDVERLKDVLNALQGPMAQYPPIYSAVKHKGKPLYMYARKGESIEIKPKMVNILSISLDEFALPFATLTAEVTSGTYIRSLARLIGEKLSSAAHVTAIRRLSVGEFKVEQAIKIEELKARLEKKNDLDNILIDKDALLDRMHGIQI